MRSLALKGVKGSEKIIDTSVIIDGRIADLSETGFLEGVLVVPQFVLQELQSIADSPDPLRRTRGRRGLDILKRMQNQAFIEIKIIDEDFPRIKEVDAKLVALAKKKQAKIITNDFNLNKVADLQGVAVLNINQLANALKPVVLPGETLHILIMKEGKEPLQGIGYLDDGTMVVVDHAKDLVGETLTVVVTSVLQTTAGRMIFAKKEH
ncbi:MAG: TRAM domain-containing protein [Deltaproteobacteria bacterium]|nr:TRAM domain-containing protein [Candidatus Anaeroferrophillus wilburensis]MBN2888091.1 TRAM domain-containing protein [Deltaproteobacteria bacterium]